MPSKAKQVLKSLAELPAPKVEEVQAAAEANAKPKMPAIKKPTPDMIRKGLLARKPSVKLVTQTAVTKLPAADAKAKPEPKLSFVERMKAAREAKAAKLAANPDWPEPLPAEVEVVELDQIADNVTKEDIGKKFQTASLGEVELVGIGPSKEIAADISGNIAMDPAPSHAEGTESTTNDADDAVDTESEVRAVLIEQLLEYDNSHNRQTLFEAYSGLPTANLQEQLTLLQAEWGGSTKMRAALLDVDRVIKSAMDNQLTKKRMSLLGIKYKEYHLLAQKVEKALGTDTVVGTMRHTEYHKQLKSVIGTNAVLSGAIREMADLIAYQTPDAPEDENLSPANVDELVRVCLSIGTSAKSWLLVAAEQTKRIRQLEADKLRAAEVQKATNATVVNLRDAMAAREEELRKQTHARFGQKYAIVNHLGEFLALEDDADATSINPKMLRFSSDMTEAIMPASEEKVRKIFDSLRRWSKVSSKYTKLVAKKGLHPDGLSVVRVTLTRI